MQLERINKVNDIKKLNDNEKRELAKEIRKYIIEVTSENGGHLASNLGVVELTIALESVFDVTTDKIIWDVGHQAYTHKILTGRKNVMKTIRKINGISGFPKTCESGTDCFNTGHSSTSISAAMGMAKARDLKKKQENVIAVIGDGALTGGMALEALNHVGCTKTRMIIILNDNEMSISKNISGINNLLTRLRSKKNYRKSNKYGKKILEKFPLFGRKIIKIIQKFKSAIKQLIIPAMYFEEIGINYLGPVDGHNIELLEDIFEQAKNFDEPVLIHVITKKGKGYLPAEINPSKFHGVSPFDIKTGETITRSEKSYSKVFGEKLVSLASKYNDIVGITAAMKDGVGMTEFAKVFPDRFFDVGIAEQHALTFAAGLAKEGMIPFVSIYSSFYQRAYDQIIHDICTQNLHVIMCVDRAGIVGADGETHQGIYDLSFMKLIPNITIMAPKNFKELEEMLDFAVRYDGPIVIRYPRGGEKNIEYDINNKIKKGRSELLVEGNDLTIIAIGNMVCKAYEIGKKLSEEKISAEIINARFIKPLDEYRICKSINKTKRVVVIEDNTIIGGLSSSIKELIVDNGFDNIRIQSYAYPDEFISHGLPNELEKKYSLDNETIIKNIKKMF